MKTIFQKIIDKEEPAKILYEDERFIVIESKFPSASTHWLIIPKKLIISIAEATKEDAEIIGAMNLLAVKFAKEKSIEDYKLIFNAGKFLHVPHLHLHLISGPEVRD
ncbi:MAG: HIT domain-containing protein [Patescibacteria group bacterium]